MKKHTHILPLITIYYWQPGHSIMTSLSYLPWTFFQGRLLSRNTSSSMIASSSSQWNKNSNKPLKTWTSFLLPSDSSCTLDLKLKINFRRYNLPITAPTSKKRLRQEHLPRRHPPNQQQKSASSTNLNTSDPSSHPSLSKTILKSKQE